MVSYIYILQLHPFLHKHYVSSISWEFTMLTSHFPYGSFWTWNKTCCTPLLCPPMLYSCTSDANHKTVRVFQANYLHTHTHQSCLLGSSTAAILPGLQTSWTTVSKTKDEWIPGIQRGRRVLAVRDIPAVWLVMCARPGKLLASLASPPLVSSWWMAVVLATPPVVTTGTARSKVLLLLPTEVRTWPWGLPQTALGWRKRRQTNRVRFSHTCPQKQTEAEFDLLLPSGNLCNTVHTFSCCMHNWHSFI